jgi:hypothetical protein
MGACIADFADLPIYIHQQGEAPIIKCLRQSDLQLHHASVQRELQ